MTLFTALSILFVLAQLNDPVVSQQLQDSLPSDPPWPNLSQSCFSALNTTASCPSFLQGASVDNQRLPPDALNALCTDTCRTSLLNTRQAITTGCTQQTDVIQYFDGVTYPATLIVDHYLHTYDLACRKDPATGQFCDTLRMQWLNVSAWTTDMECHDCVLGTEQTQLNSPFDYSDDLAEDFASQTSSCGSTQYSWTTPGPYTIGTSTTSDPASPSPTCAQSYAVKTGDTCDSVSQAFNASTNALISGSALLGDCSNLALVKSICLPQACRIYRVLANDTCDSIIAAQDKSISGSQFLAWNPNFNPLCSNIDSFRGTYICLSPPGGVIPIPTPSVSMPAMTPMATASRPPNTFPESAKSCGRWYNVTQDDTCDSVSISNAVSIKDFYFLNPQIWKNCSNLLWGVDYCVQPVGDIHTYSGYPSTTNFITLTSNTFTTASSTAPPSITPTATSAPLLPHAPGTADGCYAYRNYYDVEPQLDQSEQTQQPLFTDNINSCSYVSSIWDVDPNDFEKWNPSLNVSNSDCALNAGFSYCIIINQNYKRNDTLSSPQGSDCDDVDDRSKIPQGTDPSCLCFIQLNGSDFPDEAETCQDLVGVIGNDVSNVPKWNPWVGSDCDAGLYAGLAQDDTRYVCIGVSGVQRSAFGSGNNQTSPIPNSNGTAGEN